MKESSGFLYGGSDVQLRSAMLCALCEQCIVSVMDECQVGFAVSYMSSFTKVDTELSRYANGLHKSSLIIYN